MGIGVTMGTGVAVGIGVAVGTTIIGVTNTVMGLSIRETVTTKAHHKQDSS